MQDPELLTKDISEAVNPQTMDEHKDVVRTARLQLESETDQK